MLKAAFNSILRIHSRAAQLKRLGTIDYYSPCRISPSNFFRFLGGPESTVIHGREFIIPIDTLKGDFAQLLDFDNEPTAGQYKIRYSGLDTAFLSFGDSAATVQAALRLVAGLSNVVVTDGGSFGFLVAFQGFSTEPSLLSVVSSTLTDVDSDPVTATVDQTYSPWSVKLQRGDRIVDSVYGNLTIDEPIEIPDLGGSIMGWRCRCE
jgi:hypothetical protein